KQDQRHNEEKHETRGTQKKARKARMTTNGYALANDFYEYTMAAAYFDKGLHVNASFELFVRGLPRDRAYLIAAGIDEALDYLENLRFSGEEIDFLRRQPAMQNVSSAFFEHLRELRFTGDADSMDEGRPFFANEPVFRIAGPIIQAQIIETRSEERRVGKECRSRWS